MDMRMDRRTALAGAAAALAAWPMSGALAKLPPSAEPEPIILALPDVQVMAEGLAFPEGPVAMADGSALVVELAGGNLKRVWNGNRTEVVAAVGGSPNGVAIGPDGAAYIANSGGFAWVTGKDGKKTFTALTTDDYKGGWIDRVDLSTGKIERLYDKIGGERLSGPNDLVFDTHGGFWFTDAGRRHARFKDYAGLYYALPDGSRIEEARYDAVAINGVGLSPDGTVLYLAETETGRLVAYEVAGPGKLAGEHDSRVVGTCYAPSRLDSLKVQANGDVCVASISPGGITIFSVSGQPPRFMPFPSPYITNLCFGGDDMRTAFVTDTAHGRLLKLRWPEAGLKLNYNG